MRFLVPGACSHTDFALADRFERYRRRSIGGEQRLAVFPQRWARDALVNARDSMIATLDSFRDTLENLGGGLGVTDPISGQVVKVLK